MRAYIDPPLKIPFYIKLGLFFAKRVTGKDLMPPKLLAWYPKAAISSGVMEALVAHGNHKDELDPRSLQLIRIQVSILTACPFCIDMNGHGYEKNGISELELQGLRGIVDLDLIPSFTDREKLIIQYTRMITQTPVEVSESFMAHMKSIFNEKEIIIIVTTAAQVNYWARLIRALGIPSAEFMARSLIGE